MAEVKNYISLQKGSQSICGNYRGIRLLNSLYELYSSIIKKRIIKISDDLLQGEQNEFHVERSCKDSIFITHQLTEKNRKNNIETHIAFTEYEKAFATTGKHS